MDPETITFATQSAWEIWLERNGDSAAAVWLRIAKRGADQKTVSYAEALDTALCFGWIDGQKQAEDAHYWRQRFTPRTARNIWSKINTRKADALITAGRMRPAGLREIDRAKQDGRWEAA